MEMALSKEEDEKEKTSIIMSYPFWKLYVGQRFDLYIDSDVSLSKEEKEYLSEKVKKENTHLYLILENENKIINWFIDKWKDNLYSLYIIESILKDKLL